MTELREYNPLRVVGSWTTLTPLGTIDILDGHIDGGDFASVTTDNARWAREHDGNGNATRVYQPNNGGSVAVTLSASSPTNLKLTQAVAADGITESVVGLLLLKDLNGSTVVEMEGAFLEDVPDPTFGSTRGERVWVFQAAAVNKVIGGHELAGGAGLGGA